MADASLDRLSHSVLFILIRFVTMTPEERIGLIAGIRRVLLLTAELTQVHEKSAVVFQHFTMELWALTVLIVALVISLAPSAKAERNGFDRPHKMNPASSNR